MLMIHSHAVTCAPSFAQAGAIAALRKDVGCGDMSISKLLQQFQRQRDAMVSGLREIPQVSCVTGRGGYFVFPNFWKYGMTSTEMCEYLMAKAGVLAIPGIEFGMNGESHLRFLYASSVEEIVEGLERVKTALEALKIEARNS
jgi:aspartate/methionine/tyrosine aminotransferase